MNANERQQAIRARIEQALAPQRVEIIDESHKHAGHAGARGGGHFVVSVVCAAFAGKGLVERHRMVYAAVDDLMKSGEVHALSIDAKTPEETS